MDNRQAVIQEHFTELAKQYTGLSLTGGERDTLFIRGVLEFLASYEAVSIRDKFQIEILIPEDYPDRPPLVKETGGRIPKDFHTYPDGTLCLGAPIEIRMKFAKTRSLLGFVSEQIIPFLFSFCYFQQYGRMPYGELPHGAKGLLEYYTQFFNVSSDVTTIGLLKILAENNYKGHHDCPCCSRKRIRDCHGGLLRKITSYQHQDEFLYNYVYCLSYLKKSGQKLPPYLLSEKLMKRVKGQVKATEHKFKYDV